MARCYDPGTLLEYILTSYQIAAQDELFAVGAAGNGGPYRDRRVPD
jgi:hypothetical protein